MATWDRGQGTGQVGVRVKVRVRVRVRVRVSVRVRVKVRVRKRDGVSVGVRFWGRVKVLSEGVYILNKRLMTMAPVNIPCLTVNYGQQGHIFVPVCRLP